MALVVLMAGNLVLGLRDGDLLKVSLYATALAWAISEATNLGERPGVAGWLGRAALPAALVLALINLCTAYLA